MYGVDDALVLKGESAVKVVDGVAVGLKGHGTVRVPFEEQRPVFGVVSAEHTELIHALIMAEPAAIPAGSLIAGPQAPLILAVQTAKVFVYAKFHQWRSLLFIQLAKPGRLVRCNS
jgi:hypothetical protein